jgi:hypothetical protein
MMINTTSSIARPFFQATLITLTVLLAACSNGNDNNNHNENSTLGVPGAGNTSTVVVPAANVQGPIEGKPVLVSTFFPLAPLGYEQAEYFVSGTANTYVNVNELKPDGQWQVEASEQADYKTRIVVIRPSDPADFNGTVMVEWLNVSAGFDSGPDWGMVHTELIRKGYAWIGVSAQKVGVDALIDGGAAAIIPGGAGDNRYESLNHPGDDFSYDMYSQIAQAIRQPTGTAPLGNLSAQYMIAAGESQSASRLMTYVNALTPIHALFDGYFIHSRLNGSAPLQGNFLSTTPAIATPEIVRVRSDLGTPVLMLQTETDLFILGSYPSNQDDTDKFRLWEMPGTAHADLYTFLDNRFDVGTNPAMAAVVEVMAPVPGIIECTIPVNAGPQHFIANAAVHTLNEWITHDTAPPVAERLEVSGEPAAFVLDDRGNVKGGVRTPFVDVPIAILSGEGQPLPDRADVDEVSVKTVDFCFLSGTTTLFDAATLGALYVDNAAYIEAVNTATDDAVAKGFLLAEDAELIKTYAASSDIFAL